MRSNQHTLQGGKDAVNDLAAGSAAARALAATETVTKSAAELATRAAHSARDLLEEGQAVAAERIDATTKWVGDMTRERPLRTLGIAAAAGVIVGLLIGRR